MSLSYFKHSSGNILWKNAKSGLPTCQPPFRTCISLDTFEILPSIALVTRWIMVTWETNICSGIRSLHNPIARNFCWQQMTICAVNSWIELPSWRKEPAMQVSRRWSTGRMCWKPTRRLRQSFTCLQAVLIITTVENLLTILQRCNTFTSWRVRFSNHLCWPGCA